MLCPNKRWRLLPAASEAIFCRNGEGVICHLFHDGHVEPLKIEETVGSGTLAAPKGMWTMAPGD